MNKMFKSVLTLILILTSVMFFSNLPTNNVINANDFDKDSKEIDLIVNKKYDKKHNVVELKLEQIVKNENVIVESILDPDGEEVYDAELDQIRDNVYIVNESGQFEYSVRYTLKKERKVDVEENDDSQLQENTDIKIYTKRIEVSEIKNIQDKTKAITDIHAEISPDKTVVNGDITNEYAYTVTYKIPTFKGNQVYMKIKLIGKISLKNNVSFAPVGFTYQGYDEVNKVLTLKVNENTTGGDITGSFNVPVNFVNAKKGDKARAEVWYEDNLSNIIGTQNHSAYTEYDETNAITLVKVKLGANMISSDGTAAYRIQLNNKKRVDLGGYKIIDKLPDNKQTELIDVYFGDRAGKRVDGIGVIEHWDSSTKEVSATINPGIRSNAIFLFVSVKYKGLVHNEWIKNTAFVYNPNDLLLTQVSKSNQVELTGQGSFDKKASKNTFRYKDTVEWNLYVRNLTGEEIDKIVVEDEFPYHVRPIKINTGNHIPSFVSQNAKMKIYIKTNQVKEYFLYREFNYTDLINSNGNEVLFEENYITDENRIISIKVEYENVSLGFAQLNKPLQIVTKMLPNYENGLSIKNGTIIENIAEFSTINNDTVVTRVKEEDSVMYERTYIGNIKKRIASNIPNKINDEVKYEIIVTSDSNSDLPNPVVWDDLPASLNYKSYEAKILNASDNAVIENSPNVIFEIDKSGILRWKFPDRTLKANEKLVIVLTATLNNINYSITNRAGLSTMDIPAVQGVSNNKDENYNGFENGEDLDGNLQYGDMYTWDSVTFEIIGGRNINPKKFVKDGTEYDRTATFLKGERIDYKLVLENNSETVLSNIDIYDNLPAIDDRDMLTNNKRGSEFDVNLVIDSVKITTSSGMSNVPYTVYYSKSKDPIRVNNDGTGTIGSGIWEKSIANVEEIRAVKFEIDDKYALPVGESLIIEYAVMIPNDLKGTLTSHNNFSVAADNLYPVVSNKVSAIVKDYGVELIKVDSLNKDLTLQGAEFKLLNEQGVVLHEGLTTDEKGSIVVENLLPGKYSFIETKAPLGYELDSTPITFEIVRENFGHLKLSKVTNSVSPFKLNILKVNDNGNVLEGAEFTLYSDKNCTNELEKVVSNSNGELLFKTKFQVGTTYYIRETKAPKGYNIPLDKNGNVHVFELTANFEPSRNSYKFILDGKEYEGENNEDYFVSGPEDDKVINIKVINYISERLPDTGSNKMITIMVIGISLMGISLIFKNKLRVLKRNN